MLQGLLLIHEGTDNLYYCIAGHSKKISKTYSSQTTPESSYHSKRISLPTE